MLCVVAALVTAAAVPGFALKLPSLAPNSCTATGAMCRLCPSGCHYISLGVLMISHSLGLGQLCPSSDWPRLGLGLLIRTEGLIE